MKNGISQNFSSLKRCNALNSVLDMLSKISKDNNLINQDNKTKQIAN